MGNICVFVLLNLVQTILVQQNLRHLLIVSVLHGKLDLFAATKGVNVLNNLFLKLSGFIIVVSVISNMPNFFGALLNYRNNEVDTLIVAYFVVINCIPFIVGVWMIFFSSKNEVECKFNIKEYKHVFIFGLGVYLLFVSFSDIVFHISSFLFIRNDVGMSFNIRSYNYPMMIATIFELIFSIALIVFSKKINNFIGK